MRTVPELFHLAMTGNNLTGGHACFYCGASADASTPVSEYVKDSFTGRSEVVSPGSQWVCAGCRLCLREDAELTMLDGSRRRVTKCAMRAFSWLVTSTEAKAGSKANLDVWRTVCLNPPAPPFAIVLSDSGQKHLLYRGVVNHSLDVVTVTLETERITYRPADLAAAIQLTTKLVAATGKPALDEPPGPRFSQAMAEYFAEWESLLNQWEELYGKPLARLASWLSPGKDAAKLTCQHTANKIANRSSDRQSPLLF